MSSTETVPHILSGLNPPAIASLNELLREAATTSAAPPRDGNGMNTCAFTVSPRATS